MRKLEPHHIPGAQQMRESGASWRTIGRAFNVGEGTVMRALDPIHAERQRQWTRESRARVGRADRRVEQPVRRVLLPVAKPVKPLEVWSLQSSEGQELGIKAIRMPDGYSLPYIPSIHDRIRQGDVR